MFRIIYIILFFIILNGCAAQYTMTPAQILKAQERQEEIINNQLNNRKLDLVEGIWRAEYRNLTRTEAIYKRGNVFLRVPLGFEKTEGVGYIKKISNSRFKGSCGMRDILEVIKGELEILSIDDNTLSITCKKFGHISRLEKVVTEAQNANRCFLCKAQKPQAKDFVQRGIFKRLWPVDIQAHNKKLK